MKHSYIIIDDDKDSALKTKTIADGFQNLHYIASAHDYETGLDLILQHNPKIVFLEIDPNDTNSNLSLQLVNELYRYLKEIPTIIVTTRNTELAFDAIKYEVFDYFVKPISVSGFRKAMLKFEKAKNFPTQFFNAPMIKETFSDPIENTPTVIAEEAYNTSEIVEETLEPEIIEEPVVIDKEPIESEQQESQPIIGKEIAPEQIKSKDEKPLIICVKSYGDYRFIEAKDICYLQADNNSTDIHLYNGEMITAFKTLKHFEGVLTSPFVRIHNSYIVNIDYVSRIHTGNAVCYIKNTTIKLPFSKSYKENVDSIINSITTGNYLEI
jgi:DNA-binding LytR/AlgR family response regulator